MPIADRVVALWSPDPRGDNRQFLDSLDPTLFRVVADAVAKIDGAREEQFAATHVRMLRDQAAEMLFSLLAAAIQAPGGVVLWLLAYRNEELDAVIEGFGRRSPVRTTSGTRRLDWADVALEVTRHFKAERPADLDEYRVQHAAFWSRLARVFLDPTAREEYASLKHGLRVQPGGCEITITPEITPGVKDPNATPHVLQGSGFGCGFYSARRIGSQKVHYRLVHQHRHWTPGSLLMQLDLIVNSAANVINHLLLVNGASGPLNWTRPTGDGIFDLCWHNAGPLLDSSSGVSIDESAIQCLSREEMIAHCESPLKHQPEAKRGASPACESQ